MLLLLQVTCETPLVSQENEIPLSVSEEYNRSSTETNYEAGKIWFSTELLCHLIPILMLAKYVFWDQWHWHFVIVAVWQDIFFIFLQLLFLKPLLYQRYMNGMFIIWTRGQEALEKFKQDFNNVLQPIILSWSPFQHYPWQLNDNLIRHISGTCIDIMWCTSYSQRYINFFHLNFFIMPLSLKRNQGSLHH